MRSSREAVPPSARALATLSGAVGVRLGNINILLHQVIARGVATHNLRAAITTRTATSSYGTREAHTQDSGCDDQKSGSGRHTRWRWKPLLSIQSLRREHIGKWRTFWTPTASAETVCVNDGFTNKQEPRSNSAAHLTYSESEQSASAACWHWTPSFSDHAAIHLQHTP